MMKFILLLVFISSSAIAADDLLDDQVMSIKAANYSQTLEVTASKLKEVFDRYEIALSRGYSITRKMEVSGTASTPLIQAGIRKCVAIVCQDVDLDIVLSITKVEGTCAQNYFLKADLARSSSNLTEVYDFFATSLCATPTSDGASVRLVTTARRASTYNSGPVASTIKSFLRLQIGPISRALGEELAENSK